MTAADARYFIPVCLYPHTRYRTRSGIEALFTKYGLHEHEYLIVVADRLLVLDRLVTGRYWTLDSATRKARREAEQIAGLIKRTARKLDAAERGRILLWDEIAEGRGYPEFAQRLQGAVLADRRLTGAIDEFVARRVERFGLGSEPDRECDYEREYLLSELTMSVYCTEMLRFCVEVWERPPAAGSPDPLKVLYEHGRELIRTVAGHAPARELRFLYDEVSGDTEGPPVIRPSSADQSPLNQL